MGSRLLVNIVQHMHCIWYYFVGQGRFATVEQSTTRKRGKLIHNCTQAKANDLNQRNQHLTWCLWGYSNGDHVTVSCETSTQLQKQTMQVLKLALLHGGAAQVIRCCLCIVHHMHWI